MKPLTPIAVLVIVGCGGEGQQDTTLESVPIAAGQAMLGAISLRIVSVENKDSASYWLDLGWVEGGGYLPQWKDKFLMKIPPGTSKTSFVPVPGRSYWLMLRSAAGVVSASPEIGPNSPVELLPYEVQDAQIWPVKSVSITNSDTWTYWINLGWYDETGPWQESFLMWISPGTSTKSFPVVPNRKYWLILRNAGGVVASSPPFDHAVPGFSFAYTVTGAKFISTTP